MNQKSRGRGSEGWLAGFGLMAAVALSVGVGLTSAGVGLAEPSPAAEGASPQTPPGFDYYRENIEPMFLAPRGYPGSADGSPACVMCHVWQTNILFSLEEPAGTMESGAWTEEQSRQNYEIITQFVNASDPESSTLLLKPLSQAVGGLPHTGGNFWDSTQDPEYQTVLEWIRSLPASEFTPDPEPTVDFAFYRSCIYPQVLSVGRYGQMACTACHSGGFNGFAPLNSDGSPLTEQQYRQGFQVIQRLIEPGDPDQSRFLLKPLHPEGGGTYAHNGVRRWQSRADPEWQTLAAWVRGELSGSDCSPVY